MRAYIRLLPCLLMKLLEHKEAWMLSKFVVGTHLLNELVEMVNNDPRSPAPFKITLVAPASKNKDEFIQVIDDTKSAIQKAHEQSVKPIHFASLEIKVPMDLLTNESESALDSAMGYALRSMCESKLMPHQIFYEVPGFDFISTNAEKLIDSIHKQNAAFENTGCEDYSFSGFKIRCGGVEAFQFPSVTYLAKTITLARKKSVPVKFTAGLHHPIRHFNDSVNTKMHGFFNVFGASLLSYGKQLSESDLIDLLNDEEASNFMFSESEFSWKGHTVSFEELHMLRSLSVTSFGSCSFDEPVEDLQELNLI